MVYYRLYLTMSFALILVIFLFSSSLFTIVEADVNQQYVKLNLSTIDFDYYGFKGANCSAFTAYYLYHYSDLFHLYSLDEIPLSSSQLPNSNNETQKLTWYVQERPSCSTIILYTLEGLKRNGIDIVDFRDSRLGELSPKGAPSQQCLACDNCIDAYLLILTDDELSKSTLEHLGFKQVDGMEMYIDRIKYGK
jgi:hypothetical protein